MNDEDKQQMWGWLVKGDEPLTKEEAAQKICPTLNRRETSFSTIPSAEIKEVPPLLCQTDKCMAWQEKEFNGKILGRCGLLHLQNLSAYR